VAARPIGWGPVTRLDDKRPLWEAVRSGRLIDPALFDDAVVTNMSDLDLVREQAYRFGTHPAVDPDGSLLGWISALWRNRGTNAPANVSWFSSRLLREDFIYAIVKRAFQVSRIKAILTTGVAQPLWLPGRFQQPDADLELVADGTRGGALPRRYRRSGFSIE